MQINTVGDIVETFQKREKTALIYKSGFRTFKLSYKELFEKIQQTQNLLSENNLKKGDSILLWGYNSFEWDIVFLAAARMGVIVVPIDYLAIEDFVQKIQKEVNAKMLFHSEFKSVGAIKVKKVILEYLATSIVNQKTSAQMSQVTPDDILEIVYTSGTTGDPKGVILSHKNLITNIADVIKIAQVSEEQVFLSLLPLSHLFEQNPGFLSPLVEGCTIVYMRGLRPQLIFKTLREERITNMVTVPRILKLLSDGIVREIDSKGILGKPVKKLMQVNLPWNVRKMFFIAVHKKFGLHFQYFVSGGATLAPELESFWNRLGFKIIQGYGMTECSPVITANSPDKQVMGALGMPLAHVQIKLNEAGEIFIKGDNVTSGYYKNPLKTRDLFDKDGWLKSGDIGVMGDDGYLYLKGRQKDIIVTGAGVNVYPEDIEQILLRNKNVKDACVLGVPSENGELVHAELILKSKASIREIIEDANVFLNDAQKIVSFGQWSDDDFPRTTTMKVKKRFVLEKIQEKSGQNIQSQSASYSKLFIIIGTIAQIDPSKIASSSVLTTDLGMTSINRVELLSMIETEFNLDISEDEINSETKVGDLEKIIKERKRFVQKDIYHRFLLSMPFRIVRGVYNYLLTDTLIRIFCRRKVVGVENLEGLNTPAIFIANHIGYFDTPNILMSLPFRIRHKITAAAWKEYFEIPKKQIFKKALYYFYYIHASLFTNIYLFPKDKGFKPTFEYTGELLDKGWNILFFPEGEHSKSGKFEAFRPGIGLLVKEMRVPIVPIKHEGLEKIMAGDEHQMPRFGKVTIKIGKPLYLDYSKSIPEIVDELHKVIEEM